MLDICDGPVERAYRMSVRENTLLYRRAYPQKDWLRRSVMISGYHFQFQFPPPSEARLRRMSALSQGGVSPSCVPPPIGGTSPSCVPALIGGTLLTLWL